MTIPLDNLYHYIDGLVPEPVIMYLFYPHGSRNILDLQNLKSSNISGVNIDNAIFPSVICHDQEPLNYQLYQTYSPQEIDHFLKKHPGKVLYHQNTGVMNNLKIALTPHNIYDSVIILHSEKNSIDLDWYNNNGYVDIYYWCHAVIARDWFRFAKFDKRLSELSTNKKDFLIYCRDWSGSREYRIKFQELLYHSNLLNVSQTSINKKNIEFINEVQFQNLDFVPNDLTFLNYIQDNNFDSNASADYCPNDFLQTNISVVLETVFDGAKIHLTEKILRPIACGHPFILAAGSGSLDYLRSYGFKTFSPWIDESYDYECNSFKRLEKIIDSMKQFSNLYEYDKKNTLIQIKKIADYNKQWFFSDDFFNIVHNELVTNIDHALEKIKKSRATILRSRTKKPKIKTNFDILKNQVMAHYLRKLRNFNRSLK